MMAMMKENRSFGIEIHTLILVQSAVAEAGTVVLAVRYHLQSPRGRMRDELFLTFSLLSEVSTVADVFVKSGKICNVRQT